MGRNQNIEVSVIVACRNEIKHIRNFLDSVSKQELGDMRAEVLVADGMSDDGTRQILDQYQRKFPALRVIDNPGRTASTGLNHAIRQAVGETIIRMDAHSEYAPKYIRSCLEVLKETGAENVGGPALTRADGYVARSIAIAYHTGFACGGAKFHDPNYEGYVDTVTYGCWRKATLERIGLFDENLLRSQDVDLNFRIIRSGGKVWQSPKITSWYRPRSNLTALFRQYFQYGFWKVAVIRKHRKLPSWRHIVPAASLFIGFAMLIGTMAGSLGGSVWLKSICTTALMVFPSLYFAISSCSALLAAKRNGLSFLPVLPIVFAAYHFSYALGFLLGLAYHPATPARYSELPKVFTAITR